MVTHPPARQETGVPSLGWEDAPKEKVTHPSTVAWRMPWAEERAWQGGWGWGGLQSTGSQRIHTTED